MNSFVKPKEYSDLKELSKQRESKKGSCVIHGEYESFHMFGTLYSNCPVCIKIHEKELLAKNKKLEKEAYDLRISNKIKSANIPERFKNCSLENYKTDNPGQKAALKTTIIYYENFKNIQKTGSSLFYCGSYGTGKTHLALAILLKLIKKEICTGIYSTTMRMIRDIRSSYSNQNLNEQDIIDNYVKTGLLVLDEVGVQMGTEAEKLLIYEVVNGRYENYKPTILISNLSFIEMTEYLGARSIDRLKNKDGSMVIMDWESWRAK